MHKILNWHQIHYGPEVWKYDIGAGLCIVTALLVGGVLLRIALRGGASLRVGTSRVFRGDQRVDDSDQRG